MTKRSLWTILIILLIAVLSFGCSAMKKPAPLPGQPAAPQAPAAPSTLTPPVELTISAAASLRDALTEIQQNYQAQNPNVKLAFNFAGSGDLQNQIEQGAPVDVFISAAPTQMDKLTAKGFVNTGTRKNLVGNQLALIVPQTSTLGLTRFEDLAKTEVKQFAIGEPATVPAGQYAQEVLRKLAIWDTVKDKAVSEKDVRAVLTRVEAGNADAGIVYKTDAAAGANVKIAAIASAESHQPIVYPGAVLTDAKQQQAAEDFLAYLAAPASQAIFERHGFDILK